MSSDIRSLLEGIQNGSVSVDDALLQLKQQPFEDIGYAKVDMHRRIRQGAGEVIYGAGKTAQQIEGILTAMVSHGQENVLITRLDAEKAAAFKAEGLAIVREAEELAGAITKLMGVRGVEEVRRTGAAADA